jgi:hypothetical protein
LEDSLIGGQITSIVDLKSVLEVYGYLNYRTMIYFRKVTFEVEPVVSTK